MYRKRLLMPAIALAVFIFGCVSASAQMGQLRGRVFMKGTDGKEVAAAGAMVDVYRTDSGIAGKWETKADKGGNFVFAGIPFVGTYLISVSAPNADPKVVNNVKAGRDTEYRIVMNAGGGRRLTQAEANAFASGGSVAGGGGGGETAEEKAAREEKIRKNEEIKASNEKVVNINETIRRTFEAGGKALNAKNYDEAIAQYSEGLAADPEQPALLTNKSIALRLRGADRYNAAVQSQDKAVKDAGIASAKQDFKESAEAATKAVELAKAIPTSPDQGEQARLTANKNSAIAARADAMKLFVTKVDSTKADDGQAAYQDYIAIQIDPALKLKAQLDGAQMLFEAGSIDKAVAEFKKVLEVNPDNIEAMLGAGLALFGTADAGNYQEAANYLQQFVNKAPDTHALKADAKAVLDELKRQDVKPQKPAGRRRG